MEDVNQLKSSMERHLYLKLQADIRRQIFDGTYQDGASLLPERELAQLCGVSRVTVRKTLAILEREEIVSRLRGSGTRVTLRTAGYPGTLDIVALVAPVQNDFFTAFLKDFEAIADHHDSLILFRQAHSFPARRIENYLFQLYQKNIRDAVLWLPEAMIEEQYLRRLRGLGMNLVFFDVVHPTPAADCVSVDNYDAVRSLFEYLTVRNCRDFIYLGWDNLTLSSVREREDAIQTLTEGRLRLHKISWREKGVLQNSLAAMTADLAGRQVLPEAFLCGDGELGIALQKALAANSLPSVVVCVDDLPEANEHRLTVYAQPLRQLATEVYQCLRRQNTESAAWRAANYYVKGQLVIR